MKVISDAEFYKVLDKLDQFDLVFSKLASIGKPIFCDDKFCKTACVTFDKAGKYIKWYFNENYWNSLDLYNRCFVICHEILHLLLDHGQRGRTLDANIRNIAMDICVNEMLCRSFGFTRSSIKDGENFCWKDNVFKSVGIDPDTIPDKETMEYYYALLFKNAKVINVSFKLVDSHGEMSEMSDGDLQEIADILGKELREIEGPVKEFTEKLKEAEGKKKEGGKNRGSHGGAMEKMLEKFLVRRKPKWEQVIVNWKKESLKQLDTDVDTWMKVSRRYSHVFELSDDYFLSSEIEDELPPKKDRIDVYFFLDTSGSCSSLAERFWKAARSLDPRKFNIILRCFDTHVYEISFKEGKLYGFGGTSFDILEEHIQEEIKAKKINHYPSCFVVTDGYGNAIQPQYPHKWHIFLTENGSVGCFAQGMKIHALDKYE
ncbi:MAG: hypothetical protein EKK57_11500 [Proteobacteria bacterium]|nr:MAG: hypothetical protein EKK57_11500 [Pseudomonadota bacterium]